MGSVDVPDSKPRPRRSAEASTTEKSRSGTASLPDELLQDKLFENRILPALREDVGSRHGVQVWDIKVNLAENLNELCKRYVPSSAWNITASDKIFKFVRAEVLSSLVID